jgi:pyrroloquinoline-quinone synthase
MTPELLEAKLRGIGEQRYHHRHPFNLRMHEGALSREEIQIWVRNRYYYQTRIPIKDGMILSKSTSAEFRRDWIGRIHDHDGRAPGEGGLELWLMLGKAVGLDPTDVETLDVVVPGVRRACDRYVAFVESHDLLESVAASLTELFAGDIMAVRIEAFEKHYPWVDDDGLGYFRSRTHQAPRDARSGLQFVLDHARNGPDQARVIGALEEKCDILWCLLDAVEIACTKPRLVAHAVLREEDAQTLVVLPERAVKLGGSGREILELCDGDRSRDSIARTLHERHTDVDSIVEDVHDFLAAMEKLGVLS